MVTKAATRVLDLLQFRQILFINTL